MSDTAQAKQNGSNNSERTQVKSQKERALPANSKGERMAEGLQARADHLWTAKETNKEQTSQKQVPPDLACATANQKATAVLLDQASQGESWAQTTHTHHPPWDSNVSCAADGAELALAALWTALRRRSQTLRSGLNTVCESTL